MLAGARRGRRKPAIGLREAALPASTGERGGDDDLFLRLALAQGTLGLETTRPVRAGPIELVELQIRLVGVRFPVDLSGGVRRFRHVRGQIARGRIDLPLAELSNAIVDRARRVVPGCERVVFAASSDGLTVGLAAADWALAFDCVAAPDAEHVRIVIEAARGEGLSVPAQVLACRVAEAVLSGFAERVGSAFIVRDPFVALTKVLLPNAGARVPSSEGLVVRVGVADDGRAGRVSLIGEREVAPTALSMRAVRALEASELLAQADDAALAGDLEAARSMYLHALERAPRHLEATHRLAAIDVAVGGREEAALATLSDVESPTDAGLLGSVVLEAIGETEAAYAAACRAAAAEPFGGLSARAWARAARVAPDRAGAAAALDEALVRSPSFATARWARLEARLAAGDVRGALGDVEHLEANAAGKDERHTVLRRAADRFYERGRLEESEKLFDRALRYEPRSARAVAGLAKTFRDRGRTARALDLFARAVVLARRDDPARYEIEVELAEALAVYANDRSSAVAHVGSIPQDAAVAPVARLHEATWRRDLGDNAGASRALARLRALAETDLGTEAARDRLVSALIDAARLDEALGDARAVRRDLELALRQRSNHREAAQWLARLVREEIPAPPRAMPEAALATVERAPLVDLGNVEELGSVEEDSGDDEAVLAERAEALTSKLRADPSDGAAATELALVLEQLGRDMELFALLSARLDEAPEEADTLLGQRDVVLRRLAARARTEGRDSEADLYESMLRP